MPDGWIWARLDSVGNRPFGAAPSRNNAAYYNSGNSPWLKTDDLNDGMIKDIPETITELAL